LLAEYDRVNKEQSRLNKLAAEGNRVAYSNGMEEFGKNTDWRTHYRVQRYRHDINELTRQFLNSKTPEERDSLAKAMVSCRDKLLEEVAEY
ncbi:MAG: hypothetical protein K2H61_06360, partial [Muribaculaceae bacterium]|nr:hypothetical protein [Muribaculaceae bacterium]